MMALKVYWSLPVREGQKSSSAFCDKYGLQSCILKEAQKGWKAKRNK